MGNKHAQELQISTAKIHDLRRTVINTQRERDEWIQNFTILGCVTGALCVAGVVGAVRVRNQLSLYDQTIAQLRAQTQSMFFFLNSKIAFDSFCENISLKLF